MKNLINRYLNCEEESTEAQIQAINDAQSDIGSTLSDEAHACMEHEKSRLLGMLDQPITEEDLKQSKNPALITPLLHT